MSQVGLMFGGYRMYQITVEEAMTQLPQLVDEVSRGEEIVITQQDNPVARLIGISRPLTRRHPRRAGMAKGMGCMSPDFDAPLDDFKEYME
jgi:prevent-host-death family protein